jgi:L-fuculose-phosphate aldolase
MQLHQIKEEICDIGRRIYAKGFAAGNDGNISYRLGENQVLCTPTMICKGFIKPSDLCIVDMEGNQVAGQKKRTSEIRLHLAIMKARPAVKSVVHCHPPHATAFAVAREAIPQCVLPEVEVFLGDVPITQYATPGDQKFADTVLPYVHKANVIILANHGTVSYGDTVEKAYWWTEILDAYCRILMLARDLGRVTYFNEREARELLELKAKWGYTDPRLSQGMENCDICANDIFRDSWQQTGVTRKAFDAPAVMGARAKSEGGAAAAIPATNGTPASKIAASTGVDQEALIQAITDRVMAALAK